MQGLGLAQQALLIDLHQGHQSGAVLLCEVPSLPPGGLQQFPEAPFLGRVHLGIGYSQHVRIGEFCDGLVGSMLHAKRLQRQMKRLGQHVGNIAARQPR
jgi:hypothetical protein